MEKFTLEKSPLKIIVLLFPLILIFDKANNLIKLNLHLSRIKILLFLPIKLKNQNFIQPTKDENYYNKEKFKTNITWL